MKFDILNYKTLFSFLILLFLNELKIFFFSVTQFLFTVMYSRQQNYSITSDNSGKKLIQNAVL